MATMTRLQGALSGLAIVPLLSGCLVIGAVNAINDQPPSAAAASPAPTGPNGPPGGSTSSVTVPTSGPQSSETTSSSTTTNAGGTSATPAPPPALPGRTKWATMEGEHVRFAVPSAWVEINPVAVKDAAKVPPEITALAKKLGVSTKELLSRFEDVDLAFLAAPVNGYSTNLVVLTEDIASLPDDAWVTETYAVATKFKILGTARPTTLVGPGLRINSSAVLKGVTINLTTLIVDLGRNCVVLEVSGRNRSEVDQVVATLVTTLHSI